MTASPAAAARQDDDRIDRLSPDALVETFSRGQMFRWFLAALLIHTVVIGGLSVGTIRDLLDPEGAKARKAAAVEAAKAASAAAQPASAPAEQAAATPPAEGEKPATEPATPGDEKPKTPVEEATSATAKPDEIPAAPDDLGIGLDDTNPK